MRRCWEAACGSQALVGKGGFPTTAQRDCSAGLFIVDNSDTDWKVRSPEGWCELSKALTLPRAISNRLAVALMASGRLWITSASSWAIEVSMRTKAVWRGPEENRAAADGSRSRETKATFGVPAIVAAIHAGDQCRLSQRQVPREGLHHTRAAVGIVRRRLVELHVPACAKTLKRQIRGSEVGLCRNGMNALAGRGGPRQHP